MSKEDIEILERLLEEGFEAMWPDESQALENILLDYKQKLNALDKNEKFIKELGKEIDRLQEENKELMKLKKDHSYSVDVVRQNTKLRYELFNSIPKEKIIEEKGTRKHIMEEYKRKWAHKDEKYYKAETEFNLLQELLKDGGE